MIYLKYTFFRYPLLALAILCLITTVGSSFAQEVVVAGKPTEAVIPFGNYLSQIAEIVFPLIGSLLAFVAMMAIRRVAPWAEMFLTQKRVEAMITNSMNWGLNAVQGATKDRKLSIELGSKVIAEGVNRALNSGTPARVIEQAGGPKGIAERIFRSLDLEEGATPAAVIPPVAYPDPARN